YHYESPHRISSLEVQVGMPDNARTRIAVIRAAGFLVCRRQGSTWEVAIVASGEPLEWRIPKGMCQEGESAGQTALRVVREETGLEASLEPELGSPKWTSRKPFAGAYQGSGESRWLQLNSGHPHSNSSGADIMNPFTRQDPAGKPQRFDPTVIPSPQW